MKHICIDTEWEQPFTNPQTPDSLSEEEVIIQVGWVIYEVLPFKVCGWQVEYAHYPHELSEFIQKLTGITKEPATMGISLPEIYSFLEQGRENHGASRIITQWGGGDVEALQKAVGGRGAFSSNGFNVKHLFQAYCNARGLRSSGGLSKSMNKLGLTWEPLPGYNKSNKHDALMDAYNTARVHNKLLELIR